MSRAPASLLFLLCCSSLFFDGAVTIHVGVIVNTNSSVGRQQKIAVEIAAHHFNSSTTTLLFLDVCESNSSDPLEANANARSLIERGVQALIATGTWPEVVTVAGIGSKKMIPVLSLATTSPPTLSPSPVLVPMSYPASGNVRCLAEVVKSYNWRRVIVIYEDDDYGSIAAIASLLSNALNIVGSEVIDHIAFSPVDTLSNRRVSVQKELNRTRGHLSKVYIILRSSPSLAGCLFEEAKKLGMMAKGHVWIANDDITTLLDSTLAPLFISSYMQGVVGINPYFNETSNSYQVFHDEFQRRFKEDYGSKGETYFEPGKFAVRAYDAIHAIAHAAAETKTRRNTLLEGILSSNFTGLRGLISFGRDGGLLEGKGYSAFRVVNVVGKSYRELGFWLEEFGFYKEEGEMVHRGQGVDALSPVYWPGGPERVPSGWGTLRIGVPNGTAFDRFVHVEYVDEGKKVKEVTGFCIDVFNEILKRLKYDIEYKFIPFNGTYDELVNQIPLELTHRLEWGICL